MIVVILSSLVSRTARSQQGRDLNSDTWVATDALGRALPGYDECGPPRSDTSVGIFYFLWHQQQPDGPYDIARILADNPGQPQWGPPGKMHYWGEPELGYYLNTDEYIYRQHARWLTDAGVDVVVFDVTNGPTYPEGYLTLCRVFHQMRQEGNRTPQIAFMTNTESEVVVKRLYGEFYSQSLYPELWFRWLDKPLIMSKTDGLSQQIVDFFTFRQSWAWTKGQKWFGDGHDKWPWLDHTPQAPGWHTSGKPEEIPVSVAEHPVSNIGRSFHDGREPSPQNYWFYVTGNSRSTEGLYFDEQWRRALEVRPEFVFITGWNEWIASRSLSGGSQSFLGRILAAGGTFFVDAYSEEFSRDIEPMKAGHTDNYYYQMVANIRRYKGVRRPPEASPPKTISIDGSFSDWEDVRPEFRDAAYDTSHRDYSGMGSAGRYTDTTGRNDFVTLKVTNDKENVYFCAETRQPLTPHTDPNWMLLFIDADQNARTGWVGYDFTVNAQVVDSHTTSIQRTEPSGHPGEVVATVPLAVSGNKLELSVPRKALDLPEGEKVTFDFHWADNIQKWGDITEFAIHGDSAPDRRFNYRY